MRKNSSFLFPTNNVPQLLPSTILWMLWKSFPLAMTMSAPAAVAMIAAVKLGRHSAGTHIASCGGFAKLTHIVIHVFYNINKTVHPDWNWDRL